MSGDELWEFSLAIYAAPGVAAECLELQLKYAADVNLLLCAAWVGASGRGTLDRDRLVALDAAVRPVREKAVKPLRDMRVWLKFAVEDIPEFEKLRTDIKRIELRAEQIEQIQLEKLIGGEAVIADGVQRHADAVANIGVYLALLGGPEIARADSLAQALSAFLNTG